MLKWFYSLFRPIRPKSPPIGFNLHIEWGYNSPQDIADMLVAIGNLYGQFDTNEEAMRALEKAIMGKPQ